MDCFVYNSNPQRVVFGEGTIQKLPEELAQLGVSRPLLLSTPGHAGQARNLSDILGGQVSGIFSQAQMHNPTDVTERACELASSADSLVSIGGGSTIGLGKAISIRTGLPHVTIPTTYSGSETTPILGETSNGRKETRSDVKILPATVIYDVDLTLTLPSGLSATSGVNAMAHAVEALYAENTNPVINILAVEGIKALAKALPEIVRDPDSPSKTARTSALYGAWLCGTCLGNVGMSLHHKLCHTLGGSCNLPHADTHTVILPHALSYNAPAIPEVMDTLAKALPGSGDAVQRLNALLGELKAERSLKALGMNEADIDKAVDIALSKPYYSPRKLERGPIRELIRRAWAGEDARADL